MSKPFDRLKPHNIEAEEAVLGSLLIDPVAIVNVLFLAPEDFYTERHAWVFQAMKDLHDRGMKADLVMLSDELDRVGRLREIGGSAYLAGLINVTPTSLHLEYYARIVERTAIRRRIIRAAEDIAKIGYADTDDIDGALDRVEQIALSIDRDRSQKSTRHIKDVIADYNDYLARIKTAHGGLVGIPTGLSDLDRLLGGLHRSDMVVIAGRPGMGKTSLALSIALRAARWWHKKVAIFSLEMDDGQIVQRLISAEAGISTQRLRVGDIHPEEQDSFELAQRLLGESSIYIDDSPAISIARLRSSARRLHAEEGLDLLIVDYLQLMRDDDRRQGNRQQEVSEISRGIKNLARELKIPILALSQLSRQVESRADRRPMLSDLRESGSIEQDSDVVLFAFRPEVYDPDTEFKNVAEIICAKHRSGPTGVVSAYFKSELAQFVDLEVRTQEIEF